MSAPAPTTSDGLVVRLLGRVSIAHDGVALDGLSTGPVLRLLTCLVLHPGRTTSRTELAFRLWPDSAEAQARTNLRKALHQLRHALPRADRYVELSGGSVCWPANAPADVDVVTFTLACARGDDAAAVASYAGGLLPGLYDEWVLEERARLHGLACGALTRLIEDAAPNPAVRLTLSTRLIELEPTSEWAHRELIAAHAERGDRAGAIRAYHRCVELLARELGVAPAAETLAVYERLGAAAPVDEPPARAAPLIGRQDEWAELERRWHHTGQGPLHLVIVSGEAGAGKSRLIAEFGRQVRATGAIVLNARSYEAIDAAWAPVAEWLRDEALLSLLADARPDLLSEVSRLAPQLRERGDVPAPEAVTDELARFQFVDSLATALLHGTAPRLLVLDDVHWCDASTLGLLAHLMRTRPAAAALVVALARPEDLDDGHAFVRLWDALAGEGRATEIALRRLSPEETARVADTVAPAALGRQDHERIWRESAGNALFVVELAKADPAGAEPGRVAPTIRTVIEGRLRRLGPDARRVAEAAALFGGEFAFEELAAVIGGDEDLLVDALDELWRRHLIIEDGGHYDFAHDTVREVAAGGLSTARRRQLHGRIADALLARHGGGRRTADRVAGHLRAAGRFAEAVDALRQAARSSMQLFDLDVAIDALRAALALVAELEGQPGATAERDVLIDLGAALVAREGYGSAEVREVYDRAMALARIAGTLIDPPILRGLGLAAVVRCHFEEAERLGRLLTTAVDDPVARTEGHYLLGVTTFWQGDLARSATELDAALRSYDPARRALHEATFAQDPYPVCLVRLALTRFWQGDEATASALAEWAMDWCEDTGHRHSTSYVLAYLGMLAAERRDVEQLTAVIQRGREPWTEAQGFFAAFAPLYEGWRDVLSGMAGGAGQIDQALAAWRSSGQVLDLTHGLVLQARTALIAGDPDAARRALLEARRRTETTGQRYLLPRIGELLDALETRS